MTPPDSTSKQTFSSGEVVTAISHFYRGEMNRVNIWRTRLDVTTNWAIVTTAAFLSFGFGSKEMPHFIIILATIFVLFFLIIEARRYKYFDLWRWRVALVHENFFAPLISPDLEPLHQDWRTMLSKDLQQPQFKISFLEAFGRRLRRNYSWIFAVLDFCWIAKVSIHPVPVESFHQILERSAVFHLLPWWLVLGMGFVFNMNLFVIGIVTMKRREEVVRIYPVKKSKFKFLTYEPPQENV